MYWCSSSASARADALVVAERLLDDDPRGLRQPGLGEALDDPAEEERRDLEVEDRRLGALDRLADALVGRRRPRSRPDVREPVGEAVEDLLVELLARADDRLARALDELVDRPVVDRDADDRAVEQPALLEPVQRAEGHHLREVARDPEDDEDVRGPLLARLRVRGGARFASHLLLRGSIAHARPPTDFARPADRPRPPFGPLPRPRPARARTRRSGPQRPGMSSSSRWPIPRQRRVDDEVVAERLEAEHRAQQQERRPVDQACGLHAGRVLDRVLRHAPRS